MTRCCIESYKAQPLAKLTQSSGSSRRRRKINQSPDMKSTFLIAVLCLLFVLCLTGATEQEELNDPSDSQDRQIQATNDDEVVDELADEGEERKSFPNGEESEEENNLIKEESELQPAASEEAQMEGEKLEDPEPRPRPRAFLGGRRRRRRRGWFRKAVRKVKKLPGHIKKWHDNYQKWKGVISILGAAGDEPNKDPTEMETE